MVLTVLPTALFLDRLYVFHSEVVEKSSAKQPNVCFFFCFLPQRSGDIPNADVFVWKGRGLRYGRILSENVPSSSDKSDFCRTHRKPLPNQ